MQRRMTTQKHVYYTGLGSLENVIFGSIDIWIPAGRSIASHLQLNIFTLLTLDFPERMFQIVLRSSRRNSVFSLLEHSNNSTLQRSQPQDQFRIRHNISNAVIHGCS